MVITVKDYKEIRKRYLAGESQRSIAKALGISRNTVAKYCQGNNVPWERKQYERDNAILTPEIIQFIQSCLDEDQDEGLKKQTHTAKRIYDRLVEEKDFTGGESTVRRKVKELRGELPKAFVPLQFDSGDALQVDWGEATVYLANDLNRKIVLATDHPGSNSAGSLDRPSDGKHHFQLTMMEEIFT